MHVSAKGERTRTSRGQGNLRISAVGNVHCHHLAIHKLDDLIPPGRTKGDDNCARPKPRRLFASFHCSASMSACRATQP